MGLQAVAFYFFPSQLLLPIGLSFVVLFAGCYAFELFSLITKLGHYEMADVYAGVIGGTLGMGVIVLLWHYSLQGM